VGFLKQRELDKEEIAKRVAEFPAAPGVEGVTPLNPGFFQLERMRQSNGAKEKSKIRTELEG
jgi:hypothetical protein